YSIRYTPLVNSVEEESKRVETYPNMARLKSGFVTKPFTPGPMVYSHRRGKPLKREEIRPSITEPVKTEKYDYFFVNEFTPKTLKTEDIKVNTPPPPQPKFAKSFKLNA